MSSGLVAAQAAPQVPSLRPDLVLAFVLFDLAVILLAARGMGALAARIGQPRVVGEIVAGVLLGPTLLGRTIFAWDNPWGFLRCGDALAATAGEPSITACLFPPQARSVLGVLGQLALVFFMFLVGLELDYKLLKGKGRGIATVALGVVALPIAVGFAIGPLLYNATFVANFGDVAARPSSLGFTLMIGAMLSVTAFPVMARILQEKKMTLSPMGSVGIAAAAVVTVLMFLAVSAASGAAANATLQSQLTKFALAGVYIAVMFLVVRPALAPLGKKYEANARRMAEQDPVGWSQREAGIGGPLTTQMFALVVALLLASSFVAHILGINVIVGGFMAGAVMPARTGLIRDMTAELFDVTAVVLLPIFLAFSGLATDFTKLGAAAVPGLALFLIAGIASKWLGGAVFGRLGGLTWAEGNVLGILMNCRGLLVLVVGLIAFQQNVITAPMQVGGVLMALITTMMTGPLFDAFLPRVAPAGAPAPAGQGQVDTAGTSQPGKGQASGKAAGGAKSRSGKGQPVKSSTGARGGRRKPGRSGAARRGSSRGKRR